MPKTAVGAARGDGRGRVTVDGVTMQLPESVPSCSRPRTRSSTRARSHCRSAARPLPAAQSRSAIPGVLRNAASWRSSATGIRLRTSSRSSEWRMSRSYGSCAARVRQRGSAQLIVDPPFARPASSICRFDPAARFAAARGRARLRGRGRSSTGATTCVPDDVERLFVPSARSQAQSSGRRSSSRRGSPVGHGRSSSPRSVLDGRSAAGPTATGCC